MHILCLISLALVLNLTATNNLVWAEEEAVTEEIGTIETTKNPKVFYELIHENLKPEPTEFYLTTLYGTKDKPRALIKRSNNARSGELYTPSIEYTVGDNLTDNYIIHKISLKDREVIVKDTGGDYYGLKLSYGKAKSRLVKKLDYDPNQ